MDYRALWLLLILIQSGTAQDSNCNFIQTVEVGQTYSITSPNYPNNYNGGLQCRWIATCPTDYRCHFTCPEINLPESPNCRDDRLLVSRTGDTTLADGSTYCGRGTLDVLSLENRISVGLITANNSTGGRFACQLTAQRIATATLCSCGEKRRGRQGRIVGGQETGVNEYTMMAAIVDRTVAQIICGGVIISNKHVLTSASCVYRTSVDGVVIVVGEHNVNTGDESPATSVLRIASITVHPNYSNTTSDYDIAILTVQDVIAFNDRVGPVCLPFKYAAKNFTGSNVTLLGWGSLFSGGPTSDTLEKVDVQVISQATCRESMPGVTSRQICTYTAGKDACQNDQGGPALYTDPNTGLLFNVGIVSYGRSCASRVPTVSTRVTSLLDWIVANTRVAYCMK